MGLQVAITVKEGLSAAEHQQLFEWGEDLFGDAVYGYTWERKRWHVLVAVNGQLASHVGLIRRVVRADQESILVGGIGGVITLPAHRGRGLAGLALREAAVFVRESLGGVFAVLLCREELTAFYAKLGYQRVADPVLFDQPGRKVTSPQVLMVLACSEQRWPAGTVDLGGLPF